MSSKSFTHRSPIMVALAFSVVATFELIHAFTGTAFSAQQTQGASPAGQGPTRVPFSQPDPIDFNDHDGWVQIFDGATLKGWDGTPDIWRVEDGSIVGESTPEKPSGTTNIIWRAGEPSNFDLKLEVKAEGEGANGGIQFRSASTVPEPFPKAYLDQMTEEQRQRAHQREELEKKYSKWNVRGYQADFDYANRWSGQLYEQNSPRRIIAWRGQVVQTEKGKKPRLLATLGAPDELAAFIKPSEWNQYEVIAHGDTLIQILNGHVMSILIDDDPTFSQAKGSISFEIEGPGHVKLFYRNIWLKNL